MLTYSYQIMLPRRSKLRRLEEGENLFFIVTDGIRIRTYMAPYRRDAEYRGRRGRTAHLTVSSAALAWGRGNSRVSTSGSIDC